MWNLLFILLQRSWQAIAGVVTFVALIHYVSAELQGWYYSFISVAALYTLFDLGLSTVLSQRAAHLFLGLSWQPGGDVLGAVLKVQAFQNYLRWASRYYLWLAIFFLVLLAPVGLAFFSLRESTEPLEWIAPWLLLIISTSASMLFMPFLALVEGSGRISEVYFVRLTQGVAGSLSTWIVLFEGGELWAAAMPATANAIIAGVWLILRRPKMLKTCLMRGHFADDRHNMWSLQWRVGLTWLSGYLLTQIYTPIIFFFEGAVAAGQFGISLAVANTLGLIAQSWLARSLPAMGEAAAMSNWAKLNHLFRRDLILSIAIYFSGIFICMTFLWFFEDSSFSTRLLSPIVFFTLLIVCFVGNFVAALAAQLRAHLSEPLAWVSVLGACIGVPVAAWATAAHGTSAMVACLLAVQLLVILPFALVIWRYELKRLQKNYE